MEGDDKVRYCSLCSLNVYNLSEMTRKEGKALMKSASGPMCIQLYRRQDGTLITKDCPVGRRMADACKRRLRAVALSLVAFFQFLPSSAQQNGAKQSDEPTSKEGTEIRRPSAGVWFPKNVWRQDPSKSLNGDQVHQVHPNPQFAARMTDPSNLPANSSSPTSASALAKRADTSALEAFMDARQCESTGYTSRAGVRYQFAIYQFLTNSKNYDPLFMQQVARAYAKFLRKQNQPEQAEAILEEFRCK